MPNRSAVTDSLPPLFSRCSPLADWDEDAARHWLDERFGGAWQRPQLLQALILVQHHFGAIETAAQQFLAQQAGTSRTEVQALIHFYHFLHEEKSAPLRLSFSDNIIDVHAGMTALLDALRAQPEPTIAAGVTACIGLSDQAPAALLNGFPLPRLDAFRMQQIRALAHTPLQHWPDALFQVSTTIHQAGPVLNFHPDMPVWLNRLMQQTPAHWRDQMAAAGLRGLGGAGFSTARKWQACAEAPALQRYVVCNADEGEPGTFKDRVLLQHHPDAVLAGMRLCGYAVGATRSFLYLRHEYLFLYRPLQARLQQWRDAGWLNADFDIDIHLGAGAYVCGEETALLESLEGRRGIPRVKPPFPVRDGLFHCPTVVNNVETFAAAAWLAQAGVDAFRAVGTPASPGTRIHSVSGDCEKPGLYELPMGTPLQHLLDRCGARDPCRVQLGGPSGVMAHPADWGKPLAFDGLSPGGAVMIFGPRRAPRDIARNFTAFFCQESCGFCTPCRAGLPVLLRDLDRAGQGQTHTDLRALAHLINRTSHCGLGQNAGKPVLAWLDADESSAGESSTGESLHD